MDAVLQIKQAVDDWCVDHYPQLPKCVAISPKLHDLLLQQARQQYEEMFTSLVKSKDVNEKLGVSNTFNDNYGEEIKKQIELFKTKSIAITRFVGSFGVFPLKVQENASEVFVHE